MKDRKAYCAKCKRVQPIIVTAGVSGARDSAACLVCLHYWPVGQPRV